MARPFEIRYDPAAWEDKPYGGLHVQAPENLIGPQYSPALNNVILRNRELRSRPRFIQLLPGPDGTNAILNVHSFLSRNLVWHTVAFTVRGMFQLRSDWPAVVTANANPWFYLGGPSLNARIPVISIPYAGILYYSNATKHLSAWDGAVSSPITDVAFSGASTAASGGVNLPPANSTTYGCLFLGELDNHLLLAYTNEGDTIFPNRIRWSQVGFNPNGIAIGGTVTTFGGNLGTGGATFDPAVSVNAGFNDFLDVPDNITGLLLVGRVGYLFRQNGITEISPTGRGLAPFDFNHLWASERGIGNVYPHTIAQYGSFGVFVSTEQIYQVSIASFSEIGGSTRDAIMTDLANASGSPRAVISPQYNLGFTYLSYKLFIPMGASTKVWVYSFEDHNWVSWTMSNISMIGRASNCWV